MPVIPRRVTERKTNRMIYAVSDIHGCLEKYEQLLEKIGFGPEDTLYVLGDVVDRGEDGMKILADLADRRNVVFIRGNHDESAWLILTKVLGKNGEIILPQASDALGAWLEDGGLPSMKQFFLELSEEKREKVLDYIENGLNYCLLELNGKKYLLAHSIPEIEDFEKQGGTDGLDAMDFTFNETDYDVVYDPDVIMVSGHTPTLLIDKKSRGKIWKGNNHIAIDCGTFFDNPLGCICLDTGEEFYSE